MVISKKEDIEMAEFHPELGLSKNHYYQQAKHEVNLKFDKKLKNKSFFTSERSIEDEREKELKKVNERFYGRSGGGMIE